MRMTALFFALGVALMSCPAEGIAETINPQEAATKTTRATPKLRAQPPADEHRCSVDGDNQPQSSSPSNTKPDVANLGLVRPPLVYLVSLAAGLLIQLAIPFPVVPRIFAIPLGAVLVVLAVALFSYSVAKFRAAGTPVPARKPTTMIVRAGPYRFNRNPIYLAFSLLELGIAIWVNSVWLLATLVGAVALMHYIVIPREERYLERKFGAQYLDL